MKSCTNCSALNLPDAKYCESCGQPFTAKVEQEATVRPQPVTSKQGVKTGLAILSFIIPLVGLVLGISYMNDADSSKKAAGRTYLYLGIGGIVLACLTFAAGESGV